MCIRDSPSVPPPPRRGALRRRRPAAAGRTRARGRGRLVLPRNGRAVPVPTTLSLIHISYLYWYSRKIKANPAFSYTYEDREKFAKLYNLSLIHISMGNGWLSAGKETI